MCTEAELVRVRVDSLSQILSIQEAELSKAVILCCHVVSVSMTRHEEALCKSCMACLSPVL